MQKPVEIEDIEDMRRREGIDDIELRDEIRSLAVGDFVLLTFLTSTPARGETLLVRITAIRGRTFRGTLVPTKPSTGLTRRLSKTPIDFTSAHIHSLPKGRPSRE